MGLQLSHRRFVLVVAVLLATIFGTLFVAGPVLASPSGGNPTTATAPVKVAMFDGSQPAPDKAKSAVAGTQSVPGAAPQKKQAGSVKSGVIDGTPAGSPLSVQLFTIAILLALGIGYFRVMGGSGRRLPASTTEQSDVV